jgi:hypothetical protein
MDSLKYFFGGIDRPERIVFFSHLRIANCQRRCRKNRENISGIHYIYIISAGVDLDAISQHLPNLELSLAVSNSFLSLKASFSCSHLKLVTIFFLKNFQTFIQEIV